VEYILLDEILLEGKWAGPRKNLIDPNEFGNYKVMLYDSISGKLVYTRYYSTLFAEYRLTQEANRNAGISRKAFFSRNRKKRSGWRSIAVAKASYGRKFLKPS